MGQPGQKAQANKGPEVRCQGAGHVAHGKDQHQGNQQTPAWHPGCQGRNQRRAHHHAQCIAADGVAHIWHRHLQVGGHPLHQPHDDELAAADTEAAQSEGQGKAKQTSRVGGHRGSCAGLRVALGVARGNGITGIEESSF